MGTRSARPRRRATLAAISATCWSASGSERPPKEESDASQIGENTTYSHLTSTNAPYLLGTIRPDAAWLTDYDAATHWSQANYVALVTGQFTPCEQKDGGIACHQNVDSLFHQLDVAGLSWKAWLEAISPLAVPGSYGQQYYHYSVLRTLEDGFGLPSYLGSANDVTPIAVWRTLAS
jgi:hypothetical protein